MYRKIALTIFLLSIINLIRAQEWNYISSLESTGDIEINSTALLDDSTIVIFGTFTGSVGNPVDTSSRGGKDLFVASFQNGIYQWFQSIGSVANEFAGQMIIYNQEIYLTGGYATDCYFPDGSFLTSQGSYDVLFAKLSKSGNVLLKKNIANGSNIQVPLSLDIDKNNELVLTGFYRDTIGFNSIGYKGRPSTFTNFFVKYDLNGNTLISKIFDGNSGSTKFNNIKAFEDGYYITGTFVDTLYLDVESIVSRNSTADIFLYKLGYDGNGQWVRRTLGNNNDVPGSITQDNYGNNYFTGYFRSDTLLADSTVSLLSLNGIVNHNTDNSFDFFILKYNKSGNLIWSKGYGGIGSDWARSIDNKNDLIYLSGYFSDNLSISNKTISTNSVNNEDPFISIFNINGENIDLIEIDGDGSNYSDHAIGINISSTNKAIVSGFYESTNITFDADDILINSNPGIRNLFISALTPGLNAILTKKQNVSCNGKTDGELTVTPYFGVAPYTYSWSHNGSLTDSTAAGLAPATYTVTVTDAVDSTDVVSYDLIEPDIITFNPDTTNVTQCSYSKQGIIDVSVAGGNGGYQYQWQASDGGYGLALQAEYQAGLTVGTYDVTVTDIKGCTNDTTIYITGPEPVTFAGSTVTDSSSSGAGEIDLAVQGGTGTNTYNWEYPDGSSSSGSSITNLNTGNYSVTATDGNGCEFDTLFNVKNAEDFYIYITDFKDACQGTINGRARVSYYSPDNNTDITYQWDNLVGNQDAAEVTNLAPNKYYHVTVTDVTAGEVRVDSVYIDELTYTFDGSLSGTSTLDCFGDANGFIDLNIDSEGELPYNYSWSTGSSLQDLTNLGIGNYSVTVTDKNECTFSITNYSIDQPAVLSAAAEIVQTPACNGDFNGEITVDRSGGTAPYTYQWDDPGFQDTRNADGLDAGYYTVTVKDVNNCGTSSGINLTEPDAINVSKVISDELCNGAGEAAIGLNVSGGTPQFNYLWSTTEGSGLVLTEKNQNGLTAGTYYFTATDDNNCTFEDSAKITEPPLLEITDEAKTNVNTCNGDLTGSITITATGGTGVLTYTLNPGALQTNTTGIFTGLGAGTYTVGVVDENDCSVTSGSLVITEPAAMALTEDDVSDASCNGVDNGNINITVNGGTIASDYTYVWSTTDGSGLEAGAADQTTVGAGTYYLTVTDDNACEITSDFTLTEPAEIVVTKTIYPPSCDGASDGVIVVNHTGGVLPFSYFWSTTDGSGLNPVNRNQGGLSEGTYELEITDALGCVVNDESVITDPAPISIDSQSSTDASGSDVADGSITVTASGGTGVLTYVLRPSNISNQTGVFNTVAQGEYVVEVSDEDFCGPVVSDTLTVGAPNAVNLIYNSDLIKVYPNPTSGTIYVELDISDTFTLELTSISGQLLYQDEIVADGFTKKEIDLSIYSKGVYIIRIYNTEYYITNRVIVQ